MAEIDDDGYEGVTHAGIAVVRHDGPPSVLLAQRAPDETDDPEVRETWEFPGGGLEDGEDPQAGAIREFGEEIGWPLPKGEVTGGWRSDDGVYQGFVYEAHEFPAITDFVPNDEVQSVGWFDREMIDSAENLRPEVRDQTDWDMVFGVSGNRATDGDDMTDTTDVAAAIDDETLDSADETEMMDEPEWDSMFAEVSPIPVHGVLAPEDVPTGDQRGFATGSITSRPLRLPFSYQKVAIGGHDGSVVVGSVDRLMRKDNLIHWEGTLMPSPEADEFAGVLEFFDRFGVSVDGDAGSLDMERSEAEGMAWFNAVRASGLTAVAIPAFHEAYAAFGHHPEMPTDDTMVASMAIRGDIVGQRLTFDRGPGWVTNPRETNRIHDYWTKKGQPGYAKIAWGTPGDFRRARVLIGEKIAKNSPDKMKYLNQIIAQWHFDALGYWPGDLDKPGNKTTAEARAERKAKVAASRDEDFDREEFLRIVEEKFDNPDIEVATDEEAESEWEAVLVSSAAGEKVRPPLTYFHRQDNSTALVIEEPDENGFIHTYGYAAQWGVCHIGFENRCVEPPRTFSDDYEEFHLGRTKTAEGFINTGVLTYNVGHRDAETILSESATAAHFDNLKNAWAAVRIGEDEIGIWFSGVVLPKMDQDDLVKIQASGQVSGEWKHGALRACLAVNTSGFPVVRASAVYDDDGNVMALAASAFNNALTASVNGIEGSPCAPTVAERFAAQQQIYAEVRADALKAEWLQNGGVL